MTFWVALLIFFCAYARILIPPVWYQQCLLIYTLLSCQLGVSPGKMLSGSLPPADGENCWDGFDSAWKNGFVKWSSGAVSQVDGEQFLESACP